MRKITLEQIMDMGACMSGIKDLIVSGYPGLTNANYRDFRNYPSERKKNMACAGIDLSKEYTWEDAKRCDFGTVSWMIDELDTICGEHFKKSALELIPVIFDGIEFRATDPDLGIETVEDYMQWFESQDDDDAAYLFECLAGDLYDESEKAYKIHYPSIIDIVAQNDKL